MADIVKTDALIIGAGPAGLFQVFELGLREISAQVASTIGRSSRVIRAAGQSRDCTARFAPATTAPLSPRTGAATERSP